METYLLLDGHSLAFRAWFALQEADLTTASGQKTAAVYGFAGMLGRLVDDHSPSGMAVCFDRPEPTFRDELAADYKEGRAATPEPLREQIDLIRRLVETMGVPVVDCAGVEADDLIATLATSLEAEGHSVIIVTGDRDSYQLVHDPLIRVLYNRRGVTDYVLYDEAGIAARTGVSPERYPMLAALRGDPSDNLPGVPGVGEKTAAKLVNTYADLDDLFAHLDDLTPKLRESLAAHDARVRLNFALTPLRRDVPLDLPLGRLRFGGSDRQALESLLTLLEIKNPRERILQALDRLEGGGGAQADGFADLAAPAAGVPARVDVVALPDAGTAIAWLEALTNHDGTRAIAVEPEWAGTPGRSPVLGLALSPVPPALLRAPATGDEGIQGSDEDGEAAEPGTVEAGWLPGELVENGHVATALAGLFDSGGPAGAPAGLGLVAHRAKELMRVFRPLGISMSNLVLDTAVAGYLADPTIGQATLERLAEAAMGLAASGDRFSAGWATGAAGRAGGAGGGRKAKAEQLGFDLGGEEPNPESAAPAGPGPIAVAAANRAVVIAQLVPQLEAALESAGAGRLYREVEQPLIAVLARMEAAGIAVDVAKLEAISREMTDQVTALESEVHKLAGEEFNVNSTAQLRHILFEKLGLAPQKRTKTGFSTDAQSLERLRGRHEIIDTLLAYREVEKLRSTYGTGLLSEVAGDGRIHASFNQTVARTGRLSSDQPNLHNIPVRSALGRRFREAFVPAPGFELIVADYDQIELRVIAHLAQDPGLIEAFRARIDIHGATASRVFGVAVGDVTPAQRSKAKMISYGLAYGMEAYGLSQRLAVPVEEAAEILGQYFVAFPNVKDYMTRVVGETRLRGYTETLFGRRRYLPELDSSNYRVRQAAERQAMNAGIQGLAADIFKVALVRLDAAIGAAGLGSRVVLQVHDEIIVESPFAEAEAVSEITRTTMEEAAELAVPLAVHVARGASWAEAKDVGGAAAADAAEDEELAFELALDS